MLIEQADKKQKISYNIQKKLQKIIDPNCSCNVHRKQKGS